MIWVVAALTLVVALLTLFVLGLLRSHAELLRAVNDLKADPTHDHDGSDHNGSASRHQMPDGVVPAPDQIPQRTIERLTGIDADLREIEIDLTDVSDPYILLSFISTTCLTCMDIWRDIIETGVEAERIEAGDSSAAVFIVLKGREEENLGKARALAEETPVPVLFSAQAWDVLDVPGSPYFTLIDAGSGSVVGAGSAQSWHQLRSLASDGMLEIALASTLDVGTAGNGTRGYRSIIEREDDDLRRAGILPGDNSLAASLVVDEVEDAAPEVERGDRRKEN